MKYILAILLSLYISYAVHAKELLVVGAEWCGACVSLKNFLQTNPNECQGYTIEIVDIDDHPDLKNSLKIRLLPTSFIFDDSKKILSKQEGFNKTEYRKWLQTNK